jgi:DNA-directed RNA polymerase subunit RPC12/RpoP
MIFSLQCKQCGANLEIQADFDRFACGYCGTQLLVQREGGTVSLKLVEAVDRITKSTDRTGDELAIRRLESELTGLLANRQSHEAKAQNNSKTAGCFFIIISPPLLLFFLLGNVFGVLFGLIGVASLVLAVKAMASPTPRNAELDVRIEKTTQRLQVVRERLDSHY